MERSGFQVLKYLFFIFLLSGLTACGTFRNLTENDNTANFFKEYEANRPSVEPANLGVPSGVDITESIAGIYSKSVDLTHNYIKQLENNKVASILEHIRYNQGEEAYKKAFSELGAEDKAEYEAFMKHNVDYLEVVVGYSEEATKLAFGIMQFNYKELAPGPMATLMALQGINKATNQINYTEQTFALLLEARSVYQAMLEEGGR